MQEKSLNFNTLIIDSKTIAFLTVLLKDANGRNFLASFWHAFCVFIALLTTTYLNCVNAADRVTDHFPQAASSGCIKCHSGIELIREPNSQMMQQIMAQGASRGDPAGCIVCHNGDPDETESKEIAHGGRFFADPGSPWVNKETCGQCHEDQVRVQWQSLMMTEAGKIQGVAWAFGSLTGYQHKWGNYAVKNPDDPDDRLGTERYKEYMERLAQLEPNVFVDEHEALPEALTEDELIKLHSDPSLAAFTYIREECQRCHHAVKGRQTRGDFRGMGCSSCHIPYSNEGFYEGDDESIAKDQPGHMLVHSIQGTSEAKLLSMRKPIAGFLLKHALRVTIAASE